MTNREVGTAVNDTEVMSDDADNDELAPQSVFVLPPSKEEHIHGLRLLILPDGNNRASLDGKTYDDGGKNVVKIAEDLVERGDVSAVVACILSHDNVEKRAVENEDPKKKHFFDRVREAFVKLGIAIQNENKLISKGIRLKIHGDIEGLRQKGNRGKRLAEAIEQVCSQTEAVTDPRLELILGVNYDEYLALDLGVHAIFRSGMEEDRSVRLSGLRVNEGIYNIGSKTLWPDVQSTEIFQVVEEIKAKMAQLLKTGYAADFIMNLFEEQANSNEKEKIMMTIPFEGYPQDVRKKIETGFILNPDLREKVYVMMASKNGAIMSTHGNTESMKKFILVPAGTSHALKPGEDPFTAFLAPGQGSGFYLKADPAAEYATVFFCELTPRGVVEGAKKAHQFNKKNKALKGAERDLDSPKSSPKSGPIALEYIPEYSHYQSILVTMGDYMNDDFVTLPDAVEPNADAAKKYELGADFLVAQMLVWAPTIHAPLKSSEEFRAYMNYTLMSYLIGRDPQNESENWGEIVKAIVEYMLPVFTGDQSFFDKILPHETRESHLQRIGNASALLKKRITGCADETDTYEGYGEELIDALSAHWEKFIQQFEGKAHPKILNGWKRGLCDLYQASYLEYHPAVVERESFLDRDEWEQLLPNAAPAFKTRVEELLDKKKEDSSEGDVSRKELRLLRYLHDIAPSIGAGMVYRTAVLATPAEEIEEHQIRALEHVCQLSDMYNRIANDLSGFFREEEDQKADCSSIMIDEYSRGSSRPAAEISGLSHLKRVYDRFQHDFEVALAQLNVVWPYAANIVKRGCIGIEVYKKSHPQDMTREEMMACFTKFNEYGNK